MQNEYKETQNNYIVKQQNTDTQDDYKETQNDL